MNQNYRICKINSHDELPIFHICTLLDCDQPTRWCCSECIQQGIHNHKKPHNNHIMKIKEFLGKLKRESEAFKENLDKHKIVQLTLLQKIIKECQRLENCLIEYRKYIETEIHNLTQDQYKANFQQYGNNLIQNNFEQLDDNKINELLKTNLQKFRQNKQLKSLDNIKQSLQLMELIIKDYQNNNKESSNQIIDLRNKKYIIDKIDQTNSNYYGSSLSRNELYLAYGGSDRLLKIYNIKLKKIIKEFKLDKNVLVCQFTQDSSQLYVGLDGGYVYGYNVQADFNKILVQQIHLSAIYNIITIQNQFLITCSSDRTIIKTDINTKQQIFKLIGHTDWIKAIDYNDKDEIIASGSDDKSIKLWNCKNQRIIISKQSTHFNQIRQIQFINNNLNILSLDLDGNLYKWKIDLINIDIIKIQQFSDQNKIFNFYQVIQDQNLLLICNNYVKVLNQQGETLNTIENCGESSDPLDCKQLDNLKYIQIRDEKKIILLTAQD